MGWLSRAWEDVTGQTAANTAIDAQASATNSTNALQREMYNQSRKDMEPWREAGMGALADIQGGKIGENLDQDPGYQFRMSEAMKAMDRSASARGAMNSGGNMKALARYSQDYASNEYQNAYNRKAALAGIGQSTSTNMAQMGQQYGQQYGQNMMGMANAQGSAAMGQYGSMKDLATTGAMLYMMSDKKLKENIKPLTSEIDEMLNELKPYSFNYKDEIHGKGITAGIMAQDLEKSKLGKLSVVELEDGKAIDTNKVVGLLLATVTRLNERVKGLEKIKGVA